MKKRNLVGLLLGLFVSSVCMTSCDNEDDYAIYRPTALVTVYPKSADTFVMQLDDKTTLIPTNMKASPFGEKHVRALVNYEDESELQVSDVRNVHVNWIDSIRTKEPVPTTGVDDAEIYGNDPIEIVRDWVTVAEDGFLTLRVRTKWGSGKIHYINLITGVNKENEYELTLRHDANGDMSDFVGDALIAFDLNGLWGDFQDDIKIKLNWLSFSGEKSTEFSLKMHPTDAPAEVRERLPLSRCVK